VNDDPKFVSRNRMKRLANILVSACVGFLFVSSAQADDYPTRPIRIIVGYPPGTASDITVRVVGAKLAKLLNGSVVIENRPGNGSNTAAEFVARAQPDGYTVLSGSVANAIRVATVSKPTFDLIKDFAPISLVGTVPVMLATHPSLGVKTAPQLIALAKSKPDELFYGSSGVGTAAHLAGELFNVSAGVKLVHVPYAGSSQALADVLTGRIQATFASVSTTMPQVDEGKLVAIGVAERERVSLAPNLPTLAEQGMTDFEATVWSGLMVPAGTPQDIVDKLVRATAEAARDPEIIASLRAQGITARGSGPEQFRDYLASEIKKWRTVGAAAGMMK
jgi:tripartite-type tricarboxylate transporter receptor subunit TctC